MDTDKVRKDVGDMLTDLPADVRRIYPHADPVRVASGNTVTVFNVAGNKYRLVAAIHYNAGRVYVLRIMTHADYGRGTWKDRL